MKKKQQLIEWYRGRSLHDFQREECCPDYSCCEPDLKATFEERRAFMIAWLCQDRPQVDHMLKLFATRLLTRRQESTVTAGV